MFTNVEDFQKFDKEQMDAANKAAATYTKNLQALAAEATDYSKKSLDKAIEVQTDYAKQAYEGFVAQATKMGELYTAMAKDAMKPLEGALAKVQAK